MGFHKLVNTAQFSYTARDFKKNGSRYTTAPKGSRDYFQFWEEEQRRCLYGYKVGDLWIPGRMYFYMNFFPMSRVPEAVMLRALEERRSSKSGRISQTAVEKIIEFPAFWEISYEWWNFKHIAWYGGEFMGIKSPGNKHLCALKTRGAGFSYMEAADGVYNYNFIPNSKSYYFAGAEPYLIGDAIMNKVQGGLDWINQHCPYWRQNRQVNKSAMHQKASYLDAYGVEKGTFSEIIGQIVDKPSKTRGKRGRKIVFEEGGSFPNMEAALEVSLGSISEGTVYVGQASVFGTGGEDGPGIIGLDSVFNNPEAWDMLAFNNIWEDGYQNTQCGYFVPCYRANSWYMDESGNVDIAEAIRADEIQRKKKEQTGKPKDLDRRKAEYPRNPKEALQRIGGNGFNQDELEKQIRRIESDKAVQGMIRHGKFLRNPDSTNIAHGGVEFLNQPKAIAKPIEDFPHNQKDDLTGCVSIVQRPYTDAAGNIPRGMYVLTFDSYYKEAAIDQTSLWSWKIWKVANKYDQSFVDLPVAWCAGRPVKYQDNIDRMFMALDYYNAMAQGEISGGGQSVVNHARTHRLLARLKHEPEMVHNKELRSKAAGNAYLMNMDDKRKALGITYLEDWHVAPRGLDEKGNLILTVHRIYDIAWLKEMKAHNPEKGNYDRISDGIVAMYELKENYAIQTKRNHREASKEFYERQLFSEGTYSDTGYTTAY